MLNELFDVFGRYFSRVCDGQPMVNGEQKTEGNWKKTQEVRILTYIVVYTFDFGFNLERETGLVCSSVASLLGLIPVGRMQSAKQIAQAKAPKFREMLMTRGGDLERETGLKPATFALARRLLGKSKFLKLLKNHLNIRRLASILCSLLLVAVRCYLRGGGPSVDHNFYKINCV